MKNNIVYYLVKKVEDHFNGENTLPENILKHITKNRKANILESIYAWELLKNSSKFNLEEVSFDPNGKPIMANKSISLSHSKGYVAVAFSSSFTELGIDIEKIEEKDLSFLTKISKKFKNQDKKQLYNLWTEHESTAKALNLKILKNNNQNFYGITKTLNTIDGEFSLSIYNKGNVIKYEN